MSNNSDIVPVEINLNQKTMDESWLRMFGNGIKMILNQMFGGAQIPIKVRGTQSQIDSFTKTLNSEKKYIEAFNKYGLSSEETYASKSELDRAVANFERATGIKYPFK